MNNLEKIEAVYEEDSLKAKKELLKRTICKDASDDEMELFGHICKRTGLDPITRQIYMLPRKEKNERGEWITKMTIQTSIDGLRLVAERTGNYSPGKESTYIYDEKKEIIAATSYIKKMTKDGTWHEVSATAYYEEYVQCKVNRETKKNEPTRFWGKMPHIMLAKCAEALALRKAFPAELSGIYTSDEMAQAESIEEQEKIEEVYKEALSEEEKKKIIACCEGDSLLMDKIVKSYAKKQLREIPSSEFEVIIQRITAYKKAQQEKNKEKLNENTGS